MNIIHTMPSDARTTKVPKRRLYPTELKLQIVQTCAQPGASFAGVALQPSRSYMTTCKSWASLDLFIVALEHFPVLITAVGG